MVENLWDRSFIYTQKKHAAAKRFRYQIDKIINVRLC